MIPVLGVPVLNRSDLLYNMLESIDHPVGRIVVIDNGDVVSRYELERIQPGIRLIKPGSNFGVAASWNLVMKSNPWAPWWFLVNNDIVFQPGDLARLEQTVQPEAALFHMMSFAAFALTRQALDVLGYFDENFHPAYDEDVDYAYRCQLATVPRIGVMSSARHIGSATIYGDKLYRTQNGKTHGLNDRYYERKWGGPKMGGETFTTPFDRGGSIGDWTLEPSRLREQGWEVRAIRAVR